MMQYMILFCVGLNIVNISWIYFSKNGEAIDATQSRVVRKPKLRKNAVWTMGLFVGSVCILSAVIEIGLRLTMG